MSPSSVASTVPSTPTRKRPMASSAAMHACGSWRWQLQPRTRTPNSHSSSVAAGRRRSGTVLPRRARASPTSHNCRVPCAPATALFFTTCKRKNGSGAQSARIAGDGTWTVHKIENIAGALRVNLARSPWPRRSGHASAAHKLSYACPWMVPCAALLLLWAWVRDEQREHDGLLGHPAAGVSTTLLLPSIVLQVLILDRRPLSGAHPQTHTHQLALSLHQLSDLGL
jgi:hypothetical protein